MSVLDLLADVLLNHTFPEEELARYKTQTCAQLQQQRSQAGFLAVERFSIAIAGDHGGTHLAKRGIAREGDPRRSGPLPRERYVLDHAVIAIAGDIWMGDAMKKVQTRLGSWKKASTPLPTVVDPTTLARAGIFLVERLNSVQTNLIVGVQAIRRTDPDYFALTVLNKVVGGGPTGRLFRHLREDKGYTYGAYSQHRRAAVPREVARQYRRFARK